MSDLANAPTVARAGQTLALASTLDDISREASSSGPRAVPAGTMRYERGLVIGEGGMGRVVQATDRQFGREVALKEVLGDAPALAERFTYETVVTANLEHPGIPPVYERGFNEQGRPYYTMKLVRGQTLAAAIAAAPDLEHRLKLLPHVIRTAQTLAYAHEQGVIHRDIKPDNVLLGRHGETVLLDWGIAKVRGVEAQTLDPGDEPQGLELAGAMDNRTRQGVVLGTPAYMAPEQAAGKVDQLDERTDVFALGALLYHLLTGRAPFGGATLEALVKGALEARFDPVRSIEPRAPVTLVAICERAMMREPSARYASAHEMADALEAALTGALQEQESPFARYMAGTAGVGAVLVGVYGVAMVARSGSSFREQGFAAWMVLLLTVFGLLLCGIEAVTRGRLRLAPLALAMAAATSISAGGAAVMGVGIAARYARELPAERMFPTMLQGVFEAVGSVGWGAMSTVVQLVIVAELWRRFGGPQGTVAPRRASS